MGISLSCSFFNEKNFMTVEPAMNLKLVVIKTKNIEKNLNTGKKALVKHEKKTNKKRNYLALHMPFTEMNCSISLKVKALLARRIFHVERRCSTGKSILRTKTLSSV